MAAVGIRSDMLFERFRRDCTAALLRQLPARMIGEHEAHGARSQIVEMVDVRDHQIGRVLQLEIDLVNERGRRQRGACTEGVALHVGHTQQTAVGLRHH